MTLGEKQELFAECLAKLIAFIFNAGLKARLGDGPILSARKMLINGTTTKGRDAVHMNPGCHYFLLAQDINLFKDGVWLKTGEEPEWVILANYWKTLHPLCRAGLDFGDANHFSIEHEGKK